MNFFEKLIEIAKSMGVKNFAYYKKWALDHLKKQLKEDEQVTKAIEYCEEYLEKAYGVGTIRTWKGKKYIKGSDKKWRRYYDKHERGSKQALSYVIKQLEKIDNMEDLAKFININRARFVNESGLALPEAQEILKLGKEKGSGIKESKNKKDPTKEITEGSVVRFKENLEPGDENWIGVVLEDRGDTVVVQDVQSKMTIKPQHDYSKKDLVISKDAYKEREEEMKSKFEKHQNRSNAMKENQNAKKDGIEETSFENTNIAKGINEVANNSKLNKYIKDTGVESFCSKDMNRYSMTGVFNDPDGYKVATEGHMLFAEKADIPEEDAGKISFKNGVTNEGEFPKWRRVIPENAPKTDLFDNRKELLKLCLLGNKISKLNKKAPAFIKIGKFFFNTEMIGKVLAVAEKNELNNVTMKDNGTVLFEGPKGMAVTLPMLNFNAENAYIDAKDKMYYGDQSDAVKEFLGTKEMVTDPKREEELKQIDKEENEKSEKYSKEVAEKNKEYEKYGMRLGYHKINGDWMYTVDSKVEDRWIEGGHNYFSNKDTAESVAENTYAMKKRAAEYDQINKERIEREEKAKQDRVEGYGTFLDGKDAKTKARVLSQLEKRVNFGNGKVMSYKEYLEEQFKNGDLDIGTHEENKLKGPSRRAYNRMDGRQQEEYEKRIQAAGKKTIYEIKSKSKGGYYDLGKIAYDYAKYLIDNGGIKKSFLDQVEEISKSVKEEKQPDQKHDLEYYKKWALSILDKQKEEPEEEDGPNEDTIVKALAYTEILMKAGYPVGTIREWKGKKYIKVAPNQWKPKYDNMNSRGAKMSLSKLKNAVAKCNSEEELYNLMNSNASRFRDPKTGYPFPEVQELHDLVTKRQDEIGKQTEESETPAAEEGKEKTEETKETGAGEETGKEEQKEKKDGMKYSKIIQGIQNAADKTSRAVNNLGSGNVDAVVNQGLDDSSNAIKNKVAENEKKAENFTKLQLKQAYNMVGMRGGKSLEEFKKEVEKAPETSRNKAALMIMDKIESMGDTQETMEKIYEAIQNGSLDSLGNDVKSDNMKEETFESLTEQYNATKNPDEREKLLNKIMALEETKKEKITEMKEENEKEQGYSEKTKEEIDNMNREEYHQYMSRSQKTIPLDKIGYGGGHVTDLDNAYKMCQKIAETYGDTPEGIDKLNTFLIYNTNTASKMYDELNEKLGIDYALLDADHNLAYKNAMKTLLGTKTKKDSDKEKNAVGKYEDRMSAALKKLL